MQLRQPSVLGLRCNLPICRRLHGGGWHAVRRWHAAYMLQSPQLVKQAFWPSPSASSMQISSYDIAPEDTWFAAAIKHPLIIKPVQLDQLQAPFEQLQNGTCRACTSCISTTPRSCTAT